MRTPEKTQPWDPKAVVDRVNRARGNYLARTGREVDWPDFAKRLSWAASTITDVKSAKRPLRVAELGVIGQMLDADPGGLAFGDASRSTAPESYDAEPYVRPADEAHPEKKKPRKAG